MFIANHTKRIALSLFALFCASGLNAMNKPKNSQKQQETSKTATILPVVAAITRATDNLKKSAQEWHGVNAEQENFLENYFSTCKDLKHLSKDEMRTWVSRNHEELNQVLKKEGFAIKLEPFQDSKSFGVVSIMDVLVKWLHEGVKTTLKTDQGTFPAANLKKGIKVFQSGKYLVVQIATKTDDVVYMTIADEPLESFALLKRIQDIQKSLKNSESENGAVIFPMVDLDQKVDISWLIDMELSQYWFIRQALQQTKFKMNHKGARAKSAVAIEVAVKCMREEPKPVIIDQPFYIWIERPGVTPPIFAGYITEEDWKEPKGLD